MCCLATLIAVLGPRIGILIWWIADQARWNLAFDTFIWPLLGFIFLPFTTLLYVLLFTAGPGIEGLDWLWLAGAVFLDLGHYGATAYANREKIPGTSYGGDG